MKFTVISAHADAEFWIREEKRIETKLANSDGNYISLANKRGLWVFRTSKAHAPLEQFN